MSVDQTLQQVFRLVVPEAVLVATACVLFLLSTVRAANRNLAGTVALAGIALAFGLHFSATAAEPGIRTVAPLVANDFATFVRFTAFGSAVVLVAFCWHECDDRRAADFHACLLIATAGLSLVGSANDLVVLFLALELISIPTYVMLYLPRPNDSRAQEAAVKYFLLSVMSSALTLFGFSYLYGLTGTTNIAALTELLPRVVPGEAGVSGLIAVVMVLAGLGFRVTAFPFHFYAPDVYQGGPTGAVAFLAFAPKAAGFAALLKLFAFLGAYYPMTNESAGNDFVKRVMLVLWVLAAVTMTAGNVMGLLQTNVRRMLAYSSVANAGYLLIGLAVVPAQAYRGGTEPGAASGGEALLFYLIAYGAMTVGAFAVLASLDAPARRVETVDDLAGLWATRPRAAALMAVFLISLIGLPLTAGFVGKFWLFVGALAAPAEGPMQDLFRVLAVVGALNAAVAAYYYVRVIMAMYLRTSLTAPTPTRANPAIVAALICLVVTVVFGIYPKPLQEACWRAFEAVRMG